MAGTEDIFIGRQPILDRNQALYAYELLFRSGGVRNEAQVQDNLVATASVISHAFGELGIERALGPYKGFLNCDATLLLSDNLELLPPEKIVLEILETVEITPAIVERCRELRARGFTLALDDFVNDLDKFAPILDQVEIVKVDLMPLDDAALVETTRSLRRWPLRLLAEKVDCREQAQRCLDLGYVLFQGYYFAKPVIVAGRRLGHSQMALLRLLGLVVGDAETKEIEAVFKHEPGLAMNLMRLTNSVATGVRVKVTSLAHAITVLGRRQLQRWLQLLLFTNPASGTVSSPLLQLAATRGRLLELLATRLHPRQTDLQDQAFMTGIMSLMPALMSMPMEAILADVNIDSEVREALLTGGGELGVMLDLARALEDSDGHRCHTLLQALSGIDVSDINLALTEALAWASSIGQEKD